MTRAERFHRARRDRRLVVLEGFHALKHATRFGAEIVEVVTADRSGLVDLCADLGPDVAAAILEGAVDVAPEDLPRLAPRPPATGVIAIARRGPVDVQRVLETTGEQDAAPVLYLDEPVHLGNLGASIRVAAAAGAAGVLCRGRHDPWSPEAIRGAAGLQFALPVARVDELPASDRPIVAVCPDGETLAKAHLRGGPVLAFGTERSGLPDAFLDRATVRVAIPMRPGVSSLNLATAVAVVLYAWRPDRPEVV